MTAAATTTDFVKVFDEAAGNYTEQLDRSLSLTGENADFFVEGRVKFLSEYLERSAPLHDLKVVDFGCGIGSACGELRSKLRASQVVGVDCSKESLRVAKQRLPSSCFSWSIDGRELRSDSFDVVYASGVFRYIDPEQRQAELSKTRKWLKPGGHLALFENNAWNPGARLVMSRIAFDKSVKCLSILETRSLLIDAGFDVQTIRSLFYFPKVLRWLRLLEPALAAMPLGAQYVIVAKRPSE